MAAVHSRKRRNVATLNVLRPQKRGRVQAIRRPIRLVSASLPIESATETSTQSLSDHAQSGVVEDHDDLDSVDSSTDSQYGRRKLKVAEGWRKMRDAAIHAVVEGKSMLPQTQCVHCDNAVAEIRCVQCGPSVFLCQSCTLSLHKYRYSHTPEIWKVILINNND